MSAGKAGAGKRWEAAGKGDVRPRLEDGRKLGDFKPYIHLFDKDQKDFN